MIEDSELDGGRRLDGFYWAKEGVSSWRELHSLHDRQRKERMERVLIKMRGTYSEFSKGRGVVKTIDGVKALAAKVKSIKTGNASTGVKGKWSEFLLSWLCGAC